MSQHDREHFQALDRCDPLAPLRERFLLPAHEIYLDGNSLGQPPKNIAGAIERFVHDGWAQRGIRAWLEHDWISLPQRTGARIAKLIGAHADEVIVADSTTVNLFKIAAAARRLRPNRAVIVTEAGNFPTDGYALQGLAQYLGAGTQLNMVPRARVLESIDEHVAVVVLTHVHYQSGELFDMAALTRRAHEVGALVIWDLCHSAGAVAVALNECNADFAVGCSYKFLNGGPGTPGYVFCARRWQDQLQPALAGWMGHRAPFQFVDEFEPAAGMKRHLSGTPAAMALAVLDAALEIFDAVDLDLLWAKSRQLGTLFIERVEATCADLQLASPRDSAMRGSQVSLRHPQGYAIVQALIKRGVVGDFRAPDVLRFGLTPLYTRYVDVFDAVENLAAVLRGREWDQPEFLKLAAVT
jgi:kynureninase